MLLPSLNSRFLHIPDATCALASEFYERALDFHLCFCFPFGFRSRWVSKFSGEKDKRPGRERLYKARPSVSETAGVLQLHAKHSIKSPRCCVPVVSEALPEATSCPHYNLLLVLWVCFVSYSFAPGPALTASSEWFLLDCSVGF